MLNVDTEGAIRRLLCGALRATWATLAGAAEFLSPMVGVLNGDTREGLHNQAPERVRLSGIDYPEKGQAYGKRAKQAASELVFGKEVTFQTHGDDKYGRLKRKVLLLKWKGTAKKYSADVCAPDESIAS